MKFVFHCDFSISDELFLLVDHAGRHTFLIMSLFFMSSFLEVNTTAALLFVIVILRLLLEYAFLPSPTTCPQRILLKLPRQNVTEGSFQNLAYLDMLELKDGLMIQYQM